MNPTNLEHSEVKYDFLQKHERLQSPTDGMKRFRNAAAHFTPLLRRRPFLMSFDVQVR